MSKNSQIYTTLTVLLMAAVSVTAFVYQGLPNPDPTENSGLFITAASATEETPLKKFVGDVVHFKLKVKNTGEVEAVYIVVVKWAEDGTDEWESGGIHDLSLTPHQYETVMAGGIECSAWMVGKYFDVKFLLYDAETERLLDEKVIDRAFYVDEHVVQGAILLFWIE